MIKRLLSFDEVEALGLDGTLRSNGGVRYWVTDEVEDGLTEEQAEVVDRLPASVQGDWVDLCKRFGVTRCDPDSVTPRGGWAITGSWRAGTFAESPLELIEVMRGGCGR